MIRKHYRGLSLASLVCIGLLFALGGTAFAHAKVVSATPGIGATVATAPTTVTVTTSQNMNPDPKLSYLQVYGPDGELVSQGDSKVPLNNPKEMAVTMKPGDNGVYIVRWVTASADDNEADEGAFTFTVNPKAKGAATVPSTESDVPATTTNTGTNSMPLWVPIVSAIVALLVGLGAGLGLNRRRMAPSSVGTMRQVVKDQQRTRE